jgi:hypothetical protein
MLGQVLIELTLSVLRYCQLFRPLSLVTCVSYVSCLVSIYLLVVSPLLDTVVCAHADAPHLIPQGSFQLHFKWVAGPRRFLDSTPETDNF